MTGNGGDSMRKIRPGDRGWVRKPRELTERKVGTVVGTKRTSKGVRYLVEWEMDLVEEPNGHHPGYSLSEIIPIGKWPREDAD